MKKTISITNIPVFVVSIVSLCVFLCVGVAFLLAHVGADSYTAGRNDGVASGYRAGYAAGRETGIVDGTKTGYGAGYTQGRSDGFQQGVNSVPTNQGPSNDYAAGYAQGQADTQAAVEYSLRQQRLGPACIASDGYTHLRIHFLQDGTILYDCQL